MEEPTTTSWYAEGLRFACTRCGSCCTGAPGTVFVTDVEVEALGRRLDLGAPEFAARHLRRLASGVLVLQERPNHDCTFWSAEEGCTVYDLRPRQCRTWPFWHGNVATAEAWRRTARRCPGIGAGPLHAATDVAASAASDGTLSAEVRSGRLAPLDPDDPR